ncbi:hypothetical protein LL252_03265 [Alcanivorax marinus]|uniref:Uncharacterized protein n=1 Tax=Alloalcanivorax marinus TaxID=1177169 RepID=A0A9Q3UI21_9GAMM|nr:hypothetical protein [Alloalcanivorax marinus]MCC4307581.1 hypothetical protein [Alloalcanivorax marinus]
MRRPSLLLAAALMMATTASSWAQDATEGVPNVKQPEQENIQAQMRDTWEAIKQFSVEQKDQALAALSQAMTALDEDIDHARANIDENWQDMSQEARLQKQEALADMKDKREDLGEQYQELKAASADNWEVAKARFGGAWEETKDAWAELTAPQPKAAD